MYAHQDKVDDKKLGLKSTALYFGNEHTRRALYTFAGVSTTALAASGFMAGMSWPFYLGVVGAVILAVANGANDIANSMGTSVRS